MVVGSLVILELDRSKPIICAAWDSTEKGKKILSPNTSKLRDKDTWLSSIYKWTDVLPKLCCCHLVMQFLRVSQCLGLKESVLPSVIGVSSPGTAVGSTVSRWALPFLQVGTCFLDGKNEVAEGSCRCLWSQ